MWDRLIDELPVMCLAALGIILCFVVLDPGSKDILLSITSGLVGYLSKNITMNKGSHENIELNVSDQEKK